MRVIAERAAAGSLPVDVRVVVSDQPAAEGLQARGGDEHRRREFSRRASSPIAQPTTARSCELLAQYQPEAHRAGGLHAHPHTAFHRRVCRPHPQRASLAPAEVSRPAHPPARARSRRMRCTGSACISSPRNSMAGRSFCRPRCRSCPTTPKPRFQREFSRANTGSIRRRSTGLRADGCGCRTDARGSTASRWTPAREPSQAAGG